MSYAWFRLPNFFLATIFYYVLLFPRIPAHNYCEWNFFFEYTYESLCVCLQIWLPTNVISFALLMKINFRHSICDTLERVRVPCMWCLICLQRCWHLFITSFLFNLFRKFQLNPVFSSSRKKDYEDWINHRKSSVCNRRIIYAPHVVQN